MGDTDETRKSRVEMENLSLDNSRFSRNLLQRFMESSSGGGSEKFELEEEDEGEVELNLGLSLGGRFGVDKNPMKLMRSSSVAACLPMVRDDDALAAPAPASYPALVRTSSLPAGTEEEWRKRKELQSLRRLEAKRRRSEKQRNLRGDKEVGAGGSIAGAGGGSARGGSGGGFGVEDENREIKMNLRGKRYGLSVSPPGIPTLAAVARQAFGGSGIDLTMGKGKGSYSGNKVQGHVQPLSQGSIESQGGGGSSSSMSELESKTSKGSGELSAASIQSLQEGASQDVGSSGPKTRDIESRTSGGETESTSKAFDPKNCQEREKTRAKAKASGDMPCVFTKGDGPNGRRIDGILYKYGKGEEVRIMCVCHGDFLSPADFVKHAGGSDVAHPLKHIVINPNASPLM